MKRTFFRGRKGLTIVLGGLSIAVAGWNILPSFADDPSQPPDPVAQPAPVNGTAAVSAIPPNGPGASVTADATSTLPTTAPPPGPVTPTLAPTAQELVRMSQAGVSEDVMLAYVGNSSNRFSLTPDQIIYLNDLGIPQSVVKGMIQRDAILAATPTPTPVPVAPPSAAMPAQTPPAIPPPTYITDQSLATQPPDMTSPYPEDAEDYAASEASSDYFYNSLAPYGSWIVIGGYGRCWRPTVCVVDGGWRPYCNGGRWIDTDAGWYWQSDYSWGWAPFHYGRWFFDARCGWVWRPDSCWGPAWVSWRHSTDFCGWAPLPPEAVFVFGRGFRFHHHFVGEDFEFGLRAKLYNFVPVGHLTDAGLQHHLVAAAQVPHLVNQSRVINNITFQGNHVINPGVNPQLVAAAGHKEIHKVHLQDLGPARGSITRPDRLDRTGTTITVLRPEIPVSPARTIAGHDGLPARHAIPAAPVPVRRSESSSVENASPPTVPNIRLPEGNRIAATPRMPVRVPSIDQTPTRSMPQPPQNNQVSRPSQSAPSYYSAPPVALSREATRSVFGAPEAPVRSAPTPVYTPPQPPAHIAPQENYSGNRYQPSYSPPPAPSAPAYHAPAVESAPAYHAPAAESRSAPPPQQSSTSNSSSNKNH